MISAKPIFLPRIKVPHRLPKDGTVTIAAGFPCKDGLILCADTQEVIQGYVKTETEKMTVIQGGDWNVAITGAGDGDLIEMAIQELHDVVDRIRPPQTLQGQIKDTLLELFRKCIQPYASYPFEDRPVAQLLIGIQSKGAVNLYKWRGTLFRRFDTPECVGAGIALGKSLTAQFFQQQLPLKQAALIAIYILHQAKKWVDGCGGNSDIVLLYEQELKWARVPTSDVESLEKHFESFFDYLRPVLIGAADGSITEPIFDKVLDNFVKRDMLSLRGKFMSTKEFFRRVSEASGIPLDLSDLDESIPTTFTSSTAEKSEGRQ